MELSLLKAVYINFKTPFHLSDAKPYDYSNSSHRLHSDTLYAALIYALSLVDYPLEEYPTLPFTLSSAFPFIKVNENKYVHFFPRPFLQLTPAKKEENEKQAAAQDPSLAKKIKKIQWLDKEQFFNLLQGKNLTPIENISEYVFKKYVCSHDNPKNIFRNALSLITNCASENSELDLIVRWVVPRIRVPREEVGDTQIFYQERLEFLPGGGFFFLALLENPEAESVLKAALTILQDIGIGSDKTIGQGQFKFCIKDFAISYGPPAAESKPDLLINLSLYCPASYEELNALLSSSQDNTSNIAATKIGYEIIKRGGWITTPNFLSYRKKNIYMFQEGSVFHFPSFLSAQNQRFFTLGTNVDLSPEKTPRTLDHKIIRCGKALFLPVYLNK